MKTTLALIAVGMVTSSLYALPDYEPFAYASGSGGTTYTPGSSIAGQKNAQGLTWAEVSSSASGSITIASGSLSVPGLALSQGNSIAFGGNGRSARMGLGSSITSGTTYFSFIIDVTSTNGMNTSGVFWAGFNNSTGSTSGNLTVIGDKIYTRLAGDGFEFGFTKNSTAASSIVWDTTIHYANEVNYLVGDYTFGSASQLWIDPNSSTFGNNGLTPTATLTTGTDTDISALASWAFFQRSANEPAGMQADELRIGADWASVTPAALVPEPSSFALAGLGLLTVLSRVRPGRR